MIRLASAFLIVAGTAPASAQSTAERSDAFRQCMASGDAAEGNATATNLCEGAELALQEQRLEAAYQRAFDRLGPRYQVRLRNAQVDWRADIKDRCAIAAGLDPRGDLSGALYQRCMLDAVAGRVAWVDAFPE